MNDKESKYNILNIQEFFCIEIGGTNIRYAIVNNVGKILYIKCENITPDKINEDILEKKILKNILEILSSYPNIKNIVFAVPWVINENNNLSSHFVTNFSETFSISNIISELVKKEINVYQINDVNAATIGEQYYGALQDCKHGMYINIGTGLSMGLIINNNLYTGIHGLAGEIAYCLNSPQDIINYSVNEPLLENLVSGRAFAAHLNKNTYSSVIMNSINILSMHIINYCFIINPQKIIFGGGVVENNNNFVESIKNIVVNKVPLSILPKIEKSNLKNIGILGAVQYCINKIKEKI